MTQINQTDQIAAAHSPVICFSTPFLSLPTHPDPPIFLNGIANTETKDLEFNELNKKFTECEKATVNLLTEVCKYRDNVTGKYHDGERESRKAGFGERSDLRFFVFPIATLWAVCWEL